ncbi:hypothetical protein [Streptomyces sirii]|uniref:hypothetical protein n=1 Tax=Streptomyces sirii TaxID=3127701 RepID=UPI003D36736A
MKSYLDFVSDMADDDSLYEELCTVVPFAGPGALAAWFAERGYELADSDVAVLLANQRAVAGSGDQVNY